MFLGHYYLCCVVFRDEDVPQLVQPRPQWRDHPTPFLFKGEGLKVLKNCVHVVLGEKGWQGPLQRGQSGQALPKGFSNWVIVAFPSEAVEMIFSWLHSQI